MVILNQNPWRENLQIAAKGHCHSLNKAGFNTEDFVSFFPDVGLGTYFYIISFLLQEVACCFFPWKYSLVNEVEQWNYLNTLYSFRAAYCIVGGPQALDLDFLVK